LTFVLKRHIIISIRTFILYILIIIPFKSSANIDDRHTNCLQKNGKFHSPANKKQVQLLMTVAKTPFFRQVQLLMTLKRGFLRQVQLLMTLKNG